MTNEICACILKFQIVFFSIIFFVVEMLGFKRPFTFTQTISNHKTKVLFSLLQYFEIKCEL